MAKCWHCGKSGYRLELSSSGLCINCLDVLAETSIKLISMIKAGGEERKKALDMIDEEVAREMVSGVEDKIKNSPFSVWGVDIHKSAEQASRIKRSQSVKIIEYNPSNQTAIVAGSGKTYTTTFETCTCGDFTARRLPCKHMYKLAAEYGGVDFLK